MNQTAYFLKRLFFKRGKAPCYLIFFVTSRCGLSCRHCFYTRRDGAGRELSLPEIEKISLSTGRIGFLLLTGGEPFLRNDLHEIALLFHRNSLVRNIAIPTNGFNTEDIVSCTEKILSSCKEAKLTVNVSLDGPEELHDVIRAKPGSFKNSVATIRRLNSLKKRFPYLEVGVCTVISSINQARLEETYRFVTRELGIDIWAPFLVRGEPRDGKVKDVDMGLYGKLGSFMREEIASGRYRGYQGLLGRINSAKNTIRRDIIREIRSGRGKACTCYAGRLTGVLYPSGEVGGCELREEIFGNVRDFCYDIPRIWNSGRARAFEKSIRRQKCLCTHECFLTMNILFNPRFFPRLIRESMRFGAI